MSGQLKLLSRIGMYMIYKVAAAFVSFHIPGKLARSGRFAAEISLGPVNSVNEYSSHLPVNCRAHVTEPQTVFLPSALAQGPSKGQRILILTLDLQRARDLTLTVQQRPRHLTLTFNGKYKCWTPPNHQNSLDETGKNIDAKTNVSGNIQWTFFSSAITNYLWV